MMTNMEVATSKSIRSEIDLFFLFEVTFMEKYLRCMLADHFNNMLFNVYEEEFYRGLKENITKIVGVSLFEAR